MIDIEMEGISGGDSIYTDAIGYSSTESMVGFGVRDVPCLL